MRFCNSFIEKSSLKDFPFKLVYTLVWFPWLTFPYFDWVLFSTDKILEKISCSYSKKAWQIHFRSYSILLFVGHANWGPTLFCFKNMWMQHHSFFRMDGRSMVLCKIQMSEGTVICLGAELPKNQVIYEIPIIILKNWVTWSQTNKIERHSFLSWDLFLSFRYHLGFLEPYGFWFLISFLELLSILSIQQNPIATLSFSLLGFGF